MWPRPKIFLFRDAPVTTTEIPARTGERAITVPTKFLAKWERIPNVGTVEAVIETTRGRPRITEITISEPTSRGVTRMTVDGLNVAQIRDVAVAASTFGFVSPERKERIRAAGRRRPLDNERRARIRASFNEGGIEQIKKDEGITSDRHAWRLKASAFAKDEGEPDE